LGKLARPNIASDTAILTSQSDPGTLLGTVGYISTGASERTNVAHRSDLFSFGAILYEMVSGKLAFHGETSVETSNAILKEDPSDLTTTNRSVPPIIERIMRHCQKKALKNACSLHEMWPSRLEPGPELRDPHSQAPMTGESRARRLLASPWDRLAFTAVALLTFLVVWLWRRVPCDRVCEVDQRQLCAEQQRLATAGLFSDGTRLYFPARP
jgi:serine/threonine protein kinase